MSLRLLQSPRSGCPRFRIALAILAAFARWPSLAEEQAATSVDEQLVGYRAATEEGDYAAAAKHGNDILAAVGSQVPKNHPGIAGILEILRSANHDLAQRPRSGNLELLSTLMEEDRHLRPAKTGTLAFIWQGHRLAIDRRRAPMDLAQQLAAVGRYYEAETMLREALSIARWDVWNGTTHNRGTPSSFELPLFPEVLRELTNLYEVQGRSRPLRRIAAHQRLVDELTERDRGSRDVSRVKSRGSGEDPDPPITWDAAEVAAGLRALLPLIDAFEPSRRGETESLYRLALDPDLAQADPGLPLELARRGTATLRRLVRRYSQAAGDLPGEAIEELRKPASHNDLLEHARLALEAAERRPRDSAALEEEAFAATQLALVSRAARSVERMSQRSEAVSSSARDLLRERQELADDRNRLSLEWIDALLAEDADPDTEYVLRAELLEVTSSLRQIDLIIGAPTETDAAESYLAPVSLSALRQLLRPREAFLVWSVAESYSRLWVIRGERLEIIHLPVSAEQLAEEVDFVRGGLDLGRLPASGRGLADLEFDLEGAHHLYRLLLAPAIDALQGIDHLVTVADGALLSLPLSVLVTEPVAGTADFRTVPWLIRRFALTSSPSVSAFAALRKLGRQGDRAPEPFLGFGDPQLAGDLPQLPESRTELRQIAQALGAPREALLFGAEANEVAVKTKELDRFRVLVFATHTRTVTDPRGEGGEPALVLTSPTSTTFLNDGQLTAAEIARLRLNADWVVLSACDTAGAQTGGSEALTGLAEAFFFAGSRALLVSHWPVESQTAARITTGLFDELGRETDISGAEAFRRSLLRFLTPAADSSSAHPALWAPFVVVGDGQPAGAATSAASSVDLAATRPKLTDLRFSVWLGTDRKEYPAKDQAGRIRARFAEVFGDIRPRVEKASLGGYVGKYKYHQIYAGEWKSRIEASAFCQRLAAGDHRYCLPVPWFPAIPAPEPTVYDSIGRPEVKRVALPPDLAGHQVLVAQSEDFHTLLFSPSGKWLAGGDRLGVRVWDTETLGLIFYETFPGEVHHLAISRDRQRLAAASDKIIRVWETHSGQLLQSLEAREQLGTITAISLSTDGDLLASGHGGTTVVLWSIATGKKVRAFEVPAREHWHCGTQHWSCQESDRVNALCFPDGGASLIAGFGWSFSDTLTTRSGGYLGAWSLGDGRPLWQEDDINVLFLDCHGDGQTLVVGKDVGLWRRRGGIGVDGVQLRRLVTGELLSTFKTPGNTDFIDAADGQRMLTRDQGRYGRLLSSTTGELLHRFPLSGDAAARFLTPAVSDDWETQPFQQPGPQEPPPKALTAYRERHAVMAANFYEPARRRPSLESSQALNEALASITRLKTFETDMPTYIYAAYAQKSEDVETLERLCENGREQHVDYYLTGTIERYFIGGGNHGLSAELTILDNVKCEWAFRRAYRAEMASESSKRDDVNMFKAWFEAARPDLEKLF